MKNKKKDPPPRIRSPTYINLFNPMSDFWHKMEAESQQMQENDERARIEAKYQKRLSRASVSLVEIMPTAQDIHNTFSGFAKALRS